MIKRSTLLGVGAGVASLVAAVRFFAFPALRRLMVDFVFESPAGAPTVPRSPFTWCDILPNNQIILYVPKIEIGQGVHTALAQCFADELDGDWTTLEVRMAPPDRMFNEGILTTGGSTTISTMFQPVREAAATLRQMLRIEAAHQFGCAVDNIITQQGRCVRRDNDTQKLTYGALVARKQGIWHIPPVPPLKARDTFRLIGRPLPRVDARAKLTGQATYTHDIRVPNMLHGTVARPPRYGAKLKRVANVEQAQQHPGVVAVVVQRQFAGVVAERITQARAALALLELTWSGGINNNTADIASLITVPAQGGVVVQKTGDTQAQFSRIPQDQQFQAVYRTNSVLAMPLEPGVAIVHVQARTVIVHTSTQVPPMARLQVALAVRRLPGQIQIRVPYVGGSFGRKVFHPAVIEACRLSAAVRRPVKVAWTIEEELCFSHQRPLSHQALRATLDPFGTIQAYEHRMASGPHFGTILPMALLANAIGVDGAAVAGASSPYHAIPHRRTLYHHIHVPTVPIGGHRAFGFPLTIFAAESFMDELAHRAGDDPITFRLHHLAADSFGQRLRRVLTTVADATQALPVSQGRARGVALGRTYQQTSIAMVAEVGIEGGCIRVYRMICAVDAGLIVNPSGARAQIEGAVMMALSWALYEDVQLVQGMVSQTSREAYQLLRFRDAPDVEVHFIGRQEDRIGGLGEPPIGPVAAAVANAIFALTGQRLRSLPLQLVAPVQQAA
ncbi:MAG: molybdopterin-dependent oxidoreductase [Chloroflexales bacterium]|nr:molybdopterin-dependent oxidoreductase [Chloroflexales bacterium]